MYIFNILELSIPEIYFRHKNKFIGANLKYKIFRQLPSKRSDPSL